MRYPCIGLLLVPAQTQLRWGYRKNNVHVFERDLRVNVHVFGEDLKTYLGQCAHVFDKREMWLGVTKEMLAAERERVLY